MNPYSKDKIPRKDTAYFTQSSHAHTVVPPASLRLSSYEDGGSIDQSFQDDMVHMMGALSVYDDETTLDGFQRTSAEAVWIVLKENMHSILNHFTDNNEMHTGGSVEVWVDPSVSSSFSFRFELNDPLSVIQTFEVDESFIKEHNFREVSSEECSNHCCDVTVPTLDCSNTTSDESINRIKVATYQCYNRGPTSPINMKKKVSTAGNIVRVAIQIQENPQSRIYVDALKGFLIVLSVPPEIDGKSATMPLPRGDWDELKRTVTWRIPFMPEDAPLQLLAQFKVDKSFQLCSVQDLSLPVLLSCYGTDIGNFPSGVVLQMKSTEVKIKTAMQFHLVSRLK